MDGTTFNKEPKSFKAMGKDFEFKFIPAVYFQELVSLVAVAMKDSLQLVGETYTIDPGALTNAGGKFFSQRVFEIMRDVIKWQNDKAFNVSLEEMKMTLSPMELADFMSILITDDETFKAIEVLGEGLGKSVALVIPQLAPSLTGKYMQSPQESLESSQTSLTSDTAVNKFENSLPV